MEEETIKKIDALKGKEAEIKKTLQPLDEKSKKSENEQGSQKVGKKKIVGWIVVWCLAISFFYLLLLLIWRISSLA